MISIFLKKTDGEAAFESKMITDDTVETKGLILVKNWPTHENGIHKLVISTLLFVCVWRRAREVESTYQEFAGIFPRNTLSKKSVYDVICIYMNVYHRREQALSIYLREKLEDEKTSNDGSKAKVMNRLDTSKKSSSMNTAT